MQLNINVNDYFIYDKVVAFYKENENKLPVPNSGTRDLNRPNWEKWLDLIKNSDIDEEYKGNSIKFAELLMKNMRYIPWDEYNNKLTELAKEIKTLIHSDDYSFFVFVIDDKLVTSNSWVFLILFGKLINDLNAENSAFINVNQVEEKITGNISLDVIASLKEQKGFNKKVCIFHVDDMSYSGTQMAQCIPSKIKNDEVNFLEWGDWYLTIPYIGSNAFHKNKLGETSRWTSRFDNTEVIPTLNSLWKKKYNTDEVKYNTDGVLYHIFKKKHMLGFQLTNDQSAIYFDHKIADAYSIIQKILYLGTYPTTKGCAGSILPLINNCEVNYDDVDLEYDYCNEYEVDFDAPCWLAHYKTIQWTYNNVNIDNKEFLCNVLLNNSKKKVAVESHSKIIGGKKKRVIRKSNKKQIRKHRGIIQTGGNVGRLRKGYKYSGKRLKTGLAEIVKTNKKCVK